MEEGLAAEIKRKRVLLVDLGASMGGVEAYLEGLAKILAANTDIYALCVMSELEGRLTKCGARVTRIPVFSHLRILRFATAIVTMVYLLVRHNIDVVQFNGFFESILLVPARILGRETIYTRHGPFEMDLFPWYRNPAKYIPRMLSRYVAHISTRVICVSESVGSLYTPLFPEGHVAVIPNWVTTLPNPRSFPTQRTKLTHIVCMGRLEKYKGVHLMLDAVRGLENVFVTVVGDGTYRQELERRGEGLQVEFAGFQRDPTPFYQKADIFVMPSLGPEGLPMVALEAMSHMLPCVFSDLPVHCEISENGRAAMLFRCGDIQDLREKLKFLLDNVAECNKLATNAYDVVRRKYHEPVARQAYLEVFSAVQSPSV
jgi:glycosyltransferase involved in cell wall biosynthesis